jgi:uncharacterized protein YyaL (SSP411 family)
VPHTQVVVVGEDETADQLYRQALAAPSYGRSVLKLNFSQAVPQNLPPVLAATIPELPAVREKRTAAIVCSEGSCTPPAHDVTELKNVLMPQQPAA